jgi:hypothetical protein
MYLPPEIFELIMSFTFPHTFVGQLTFYQETHKVERKLFLEECYAQFLDEFGPDGIWAAETPIEDMGKQELKLYFKAFLNQTYGPTAFSFGRFCYNIFKSKNGSNSQ